MLQAGGFDELSSHVGAYGIGTSIFTLFGKCLLQKLSTSSCFGKMGLARKPGALNALNPYLLKEVTSGLCSPANSLNWMDFSAQLAVRMKPDRRLPKLCPWKSAIGCWSRKCQTTVRDTGLLGYFLTGNCGCVPVSKINDNTSSKNDTCCAGPICHWIPCAHEASRWRKQGLIGQSLQLSSGSWQDHLII